MRFTLRFMLLAVLVGCNRPTYDMVITNGTIMDGTGAEGFAGDLAIRDGRVVAIGDLGGYEAIRTVDATGLIVAPGFIDMHNHSDNTLLEDPNCESMIRQGVTTMVLGEGNSQGPVHEEEAPWTTLDGYFKYVEAKGVATNICSYVGEGQVWTYVKGYDMTPATQAEIEAMKAQVDEAMRDGAMGLSTSLLMPPANLITTGQLVDLAKVAAAYGGIYSTHIRDEGEGVFDAIREAIHVSKGAAIRVDVIHLKIAHQRLWGRMNEVVAIIDSARAAGLDVRANVYPYTAGNNDLRSIIPPWAHDGGNEKMLERLRDPNMRERMRKEILNGLPSWYNHYLATGGGWEGMLLVSLSNEKNKPFMGRRMSDLIAARAADPVDVLFDLLLEENGSVSTVFFHHAESDMQFAMQQPFTSIGSDGSAIAKDGPQAGKHVHPRWYGTFPRVLGHYARDLGVITLPEAVRKMTAMNAEKLNMKDRGMLKLGYFADITLFDPNTVIDRATFESPHQYPVGIPYVIVHGTLVLDGGQLTGALPGEVVRGPGYNRDL